MAMLFSLSCAPITLYSVDLKYAPSKQSPDGKTAGNISVTVAGFRDARPVEDAVLIGKVVKADGGSIPVVLKYRKAADAVTVGMKDYLQRAGYVVAKETPEWNLQESAIRKEWGGFLVGGSIDELNVICRESIPMKKYEAKVRLTVLFADAEKGMVFHKTTVESALSREDFRFSEEELEQQISGALSDAIEKVFENRSLKQKMEAMIGR
jgi:hypothetical protein